MTLKARIVSRADNYKDKEVQLYETQALKMEAKFAMSLLEKWGPVCMINDGEDSVGRAMFRPLTPEETVDRAFEITRLAFKKANEEDLIIDLPDLKEINTPD